MRGGDGSVGAGKLAAATSAKDLQVLAVYPGGAVKNSTNQNAEYPGSEGIALMMLCCDGTAGKTQIGITDWGLGPKLKQLIVWF